MVEIESKCAHVWITDQINLTTAVNVEMVREDPSYLTVGTFPLMYVN